jgi:hypothetical protein
VNPLRFWKLVAFVVHVCHSSFTLLSPVVNVACLVDLEDEVWIMRSKIQSVVLVIADFLPFIHHEDFKDCH